MMVQLGHVNETDENVRPRYKGCAGGLQYWTEQKAANEILLQQLCKEWDPRGALYALIREFHQKVEVLRDHANFEEQPNILDALEKAKPAIESAKEFCTRYGDAKNPLTLAEKFEWKKMFRWLHANLFPDKHSKGGWPEDEPWVSENLRGQTGCAARLSIDGATAGTPDCGEVCPDSTSAWGQRKRRARPFRLSFAIRRTHHDTGSQLL
jgi:hypothetical protein